MIFNAYAVLAIFVGLIELLLGVVVVVLAISARRRRRTAVPTEHPGEIAESRGSLLLLVAFALLGASVASWPLLYLLLQSYVPEWVGVMCVEGVCRIGSGSEGAAGWLPTLLRVLQITKPALVFAAGAWLVLHLANRRTRTGPLAGRAFGVLTIVGLLATLDAGAQLGYVAIPKKERFLARGCCVVPDDVADRASSFGAGAAPSESGGPSRTALVIAFYALAGGLVVGTRWAALRSTRENADRVSGARAGWSSDALAIAALATLPVAVLFLTNVAAPAFLSKPEHHCAYCLLTVPIAVAAIASFLLGTFATGWAGVADRLAYTGETAAIVPAQRRRLLHVACLSYLVALILVTGGLLAS